MLSRHLDLGLRGSRSAPAGYFALALALSACAWAALDLVASLEGHDKAASSLERSLRRQRHVVQLASRAAVSSDASNTVQAGASATLLRRLDAPWDAAFTAVETAASGAKGEISFDSMQLQLTEVGEWEVSVTARARSTEAVLTLLETINALPAVRDARLLDQQKDQGGSGELRFRLAFHALDGSRAAATAR